MVEFGMRPYFQQQLSLRTYFGTTKQLWPNRYKREYFLSFEDALWNLLPRFGIEKEAVIFLPDFYCLDVISNINAHGYKVVLYELDENLLPRLKELYSQIRLNQPRVFIDFFVAGLPSNLATNIRPHLPQGTLYIYDLVHTLVDSKYGELLDKNTLILTSTRKVSPYFGSLAVYLDKISPNTFRLPLVYTISALLKWSLYLLTLKLSILLSAPLFARYADRVLTSHDNQIGDAKHSAPLPNIFLKIHDFLQTEKIQQIRIKQYFLYYRLLKKVDNIKFLERAKSFSYLLRGFPLFVPSRIRAKFLTACEKMGYFSWTMFEDSAWKSDQNLVLLPMGGDFSRNDIENIARIVQKALTAAEQYDTITA